MQPPSTKGTGTSARLQVDFELRTSAEAMTATAI